MNVNVISGLGQGWGESGLGSENSVSFIRSASSSHVGETSMCLTLFQSQGYSSK